MRIFLCLLQHETQTIRLLITFHIRCRRKNNGYSYIKVHISKFQHPSSNAYSKQNLMITFHRFVIVGSLVRQSAWFLLYSGSILAWWLVLNEILTNTMFLIAGQALLSSMIFFLALIQHTVSSALLLVCTVMDRKWGSHQPCLLCAVKWEVGLTTCLKGSRATLQFYLQGNRCQGNRDLMRISCVQDRSV